MERLRPRKARDAKWHFRQEISRCVLIITNNKKTKNKKEWEEPKEKKKGLKISKMENLGREKKSDHVFKMENSIHPIFTLSYKCMLQKDFAWIFPGVCCCFELDPQNKMSPPSLSLTTLTLSVSYINNNKKFWTEKNFFFKKSNKKLSLILFYGIIRFSIFIYYSLMKKKPLQCELEFITECGNYIAFCHG